MKEYRSFDEIDRDLKILKLQSEIDKEEIKLNVRRTKEGLNPKYLFKNAAYVVKRKALELTAVAKEVGNSVING
jgi:hypothetical protein